MTGVQEWVQRQQARLDEAAGDWLSQVDLDRSLGSVDDVVMAVADHVVPPGEATPAPDLRPGWTSEPGRAYVAQVLDDTSLDRLDVAAFYAGGPSSR